MVWCGVDHRMHWQVWDYVGCCIDDEGGVWIVLTDIYHCVYGNVNCVLINVDCVSINVECAPINFDSVRQAW